MICLRYASVDNEELAVCLDRRLSLDQFYRNVSVQYDAVIRIKTEVLEYFYCDLFLVDQLVVRDLVLFMC